MAGTLTTVCWLPQVVRSIRTRRMDDFSWPYLGLLLAGMLLWLLYGLTRNDPVIVGTNGITSTVLLMLICLKGHTVLKATRADQATDAQSRHDAVLASREAHRPGAS
jgi:MtN3 and saliva related transmembrane protein